MRGSGWVWFRTVVEAKSTPRVLRPQVFYDLKQFLETNKTPVPPQLARHEAARQKPGALDGRPKRDQIQYAKH